MTQLPVYHRAGQREKRNRRLMLRAFLSFQDCVRFDRQVRRQRGRVPFAAPLAAKYAGTGM